MEQQDTKVSVRLSPSDIRILDQLVIDGRFSSKMDAFKEAIHMLISSQYSDDEIQAILSEPEKAVNMISSEELEKFKAGITTALEEQQDRRTEQE